MILECIRSITVLLDGQFRVQSPLSPKVYQICSMSGDPLGGWSPCRWSDPSSPSHQPGNRGWRLGLWERTNKLKIKSIFPPQKKKVLKRLINHDLVWAEDNECWNTPHRNLTFWLQLPVHSGTAATSQEQRRRTPTEQQLWVTQQCSWKRKHCTFEFLQQWDLHSRWGRGSNRFEVTDDKGYKVRAHGHSFGKLVFKEAIIHLHSFYLKFTPTHKNTYQCNVLYMHKLSEHAHWDSKRTTGMLDREMYSGLLRIRTEKLALKLGSSKQGNAVRALVGSKWVEAKFLEEKGKKLISVNRGHSVKCKFPVRQEFQSIGWHLRSDLVSPVLVLYVLL